MGAYSVQQGPEGILPAQAGSDGLVTYPGACVFMLLCYVLPGFFPARYDVMAALHGQFVQSALARSCLVGWLG
jgi:hypothetical protein